MKGLILPATEKGRKTYRNMVWVGIIILVVSILGMVWEQMVLLLICTIISGLALIWVGKGSEMMLFKSLDIDPESKTEIRYRWSDTGEVIYIDCDLEQD